jgi:hypothetical protein
MHASWWLEVSGKGDVVLRSSLRGQSRTFGVVSEFYLNEICEASSGMHDHVAKKISDCSCFVCKFWQTGGSVGWRRCTSGDRLDA